MRIVPKREPERAITRPRGWDPFETMQELLGLDPFRPLLSSGGGETFAPTFEVKETKDAYHFKADVPGIKEEDLEVSLTTNRLTVSGHRDEERREDGDRYFTYERNYGSFSRSFTLPEGVDSDSVQAELKDGVLSVTIPKKPETQPKRISLRSGGKPKELGKA
jgi:HSP20 family protein